MTLLATGSENVLQKPNPQILVFSPYEGQATAIALVLGTQGYSVHEASGMRGLLEALSFGRFDAVVLDLCDSDVEVHIEDFLRLHPKVLFLTCDRAVHGIFLPKGYPAVLEKPLDPEQLALKLQDLLTEKTA